MRTGMCVNARIDSTSSLMVAAAVVATMKISGSVNRNNIISGYTLWNVMDDTAAAALLLLFPCQALQR